MKKKQIIGLIVAAVGGYFLLFGRKANAAGSAVNDPFVNLSELLPGGSSGRNTFTPVDTSVDVIGGDSNSLATEKAVLSPTPVVSAPSPVVKPTGFGGILTRTRDIVLKNQV